jgi:hypothetical protein
VLKCSLQGHQRIVFFHTTVLNTRTRTQTTSTVRSSEGFQFIRNGLAVQYYRGVHSLAAQCLMASENPPSGGEW